MSNLENKFSMGVNKPLGFGNILDLIKVDEEVCEKKGTEFSVFHKTVSLKDG